MRREPVLHVYPAVLLSRLQWLPRCPHPPRGAAAGPVWPELSDVILSKNVSWCRVSDSIVGECRGQMLKKIQSDREHAEKLERTDIAAPQARRGGSAASAGFRAGGSCKAAAALPQPLTAPTCICYANEWH